MSIGFIVDCYLCAAIVIFLQLWPCNFFQQAVKEQMKSGYVAGWSK